MQTSTGKTEQEQGRKERKEERKEGAMEANGERHREGKNNEWREIFGRVNENHQGQESGGWEKGREGKKDRAC